MALDLDLESAHRYLVLTRYLEGLPGPERRALLRDPQATVQGLLQRLELQRSAGQWTDPGEPATLEALELALLPVLDVGRCYRLGRRFREACYRAAVQLLRAAPGFGAEAAARAALVVRQAACIDLDITLSQAERYARLVRFLDSLPGNPYKVAAQLAATFPGGLPEVLQDARERGWQDPGEPSPFELGSVIEPLTSARAAYNRAGVVRRRMYEHWMRDHHLLEEEMLDRVAEEMGGLREQLQRYLLVRRYCDSLDQRRRAEILDLGRQKTLQLVADVARMVAEGQWRDPGERSFEVGWAGSRPGIAGMDPKPAAPAGVLTRGGGGAAGGGAGPRQGAQDRGHRRRCRGPAVM